MARITTLLICNRFVSIKVRGILSAEESNKWASINWLQCLSGGERQQSLTNVHSITNTNQWRTVFHRRLKNFRFSSFSFVITANYTRFLFSYNEAHCLSHASIHYCWSFGPSTHSTFFPLFLELETPSRGRDQTASGAKLNFQFPILFNFLSFFLFPFHFLAIIYVVSASQHYQLSNCITLISLCTT